MKTGRNQPKQGGAENEQGDTAVMHEKMQNTIGAVVENEGGAMNTVFESFAYHLRYLRCLMKDDVTGLFTIHIPFSYSITRQVPQEKLGKGGEKLFQSP